MNGGTYVSIFSPHLKIMLFNNVNCVHSISAIVFRIQDVARSNRIIHHIKPFVPVVYFFLCL